MGLWTEISKHRIIADIEDQLNWHGKPLAAKADDTLKAIKQSMEGQQQESVSLRPQPVTAKVPAVDISDIKLSEPPNYTKGQPVI